MRVRELDLPEPFELGAFCELLARRRGRPIELWPLAGLGGRTQGAWIATSAADIIVYEERTTRVHQAHIVLHELSHIICGHEADVGGETGALFPDLSDDMVRGVLQRHSYATREEREAEILASLIYERARPVNAGNAGIPAADPALSQRLEAFRRA